MTWVRSYGNLTSKADPAYTPDGQRKWRNLSDPELLNLVAAELEEPSLSEFGIAYLLRKTAQDWDTACWFRDTVLMWKERVAVAMQVHGLSGLSMTRLDIIIDTLEKELDDGD